jgi:hypothetical protein
MVKYLSHADGLMTESNWKRKLRVWWRETKYRINGFLKDFAGIQWLITSQEEEEFQKRLEENMKKDEGKYG